MSKTHWIIGFLFFLFVMIASGCKNVQWEDHSDVASDITSGRFLPWNAFFGGDPKIKTAAETEAITWPSLAQSGLISMNEYNAYLAQQWESNDRPDGRPNGWSSTTGYSPYPSGGPPQYYLWNGQLLLIPDPNTIEHQHYLRRTRGYGKK